tara:strand:+ start:11904 stop:12233 length:330 start_codon:yes stop_codon:yes gene_type:complete
MNIEVHLPKEMEPYAEDLKFFFSTMVRKLHTNRHKGVGYNVPLPALLTGIEKELGEVAQALDTQGQFEVAIEAADVANFAFLLAREVWHMSRQSFEGERKEFNQKRMLK